MERGRSKQTVMECGTCRGPVVCETDVDGVSYYVPVESRLVRENFENDVLRDKLKSAERIIVRLRSQVRDFEAR